MNLFQDEDTLKTAFSFQQEQKQKKTSSFGIWVGACLFLATLGAIGYLQVDNGGNRNNNRQPVESSSAPFLIIQS